MFIKVLTSNIGVERKTVTNAGIAVRVPGRYPIWFLLLARIHLKRVGIDRGDMKKENKNNIRTDSCKNRVYIVSDRTLLLCFVSWISSMIWIIKIEKIIQFDYQLNITAMSTYLSKNELCEHVSLSRDCFALEERSVLI